MPCPGTRLIPKPLKPGEIPPDVGMQGLIKLKRVNGNAVDVFGEVTNSRYAFSERPILSVDVRDAIYLLGKDYVLGS